GVRVPMSDLFGVAGTRLLDELALDAPFHARVLSLRRLIDAYTFEIDVLAKRTAGHLTRHRGFQAVQTIPGVGPVLGAVFVAEIGDVSRFPRAEKVVRLGRYDPAPPRIRYQDPPRADHQAGQPVGPLGGSRGGATPARRRDRAHPGSAHRTPWGEHRHRRRR